ncbi:MAG TPA: hypothetical protein VFC58_06060 [Desulfosporosinus sp.]|nr:hypothetical protein [Desulfosporosinus sp.]
MISQFESIKTAFQGYLTISPPNEKIAYILALKKANPLKAIPWLLSVGAIDSLEANDSLLLKKNELLKSSDELFNVMIQYGDKSKQNDLVQTQINQLISVLDEQSSKLTYYYINQPQQDHQQVFEVIQLVNSQFRSVTERLNKLQPVQESLEGISMVD